MIKRVGSRMTKGISKWFTKQYWENKFLSIRNFRIKDLNRTHFLYVFKLTAKLLLLFSGFFLAFYLVVSFGFFGRMPSKAALKAHQNHVASEVYSADSVLLGRYFIQDRTNVEYEDISEEVIKALIATEDVRFYEHNGIDSRSLMRVIVKSLLLQDESSGGGSTISQQLAKNLYPRRNYSFLTTPVNKLQEMIIARKLEKVYSKEEILELYLNTVPLGGNLFGIERASWRFFNKPAKKLNTVEAAVLVGMLKATTTYNPRLNPEKSLQRRNVVINQMVKYNKLNAATAKELKEKPLKLDYRFSTHSEGLAPYFREQLRLELAKWCATQKKENGENYNLYTDGLTIYTTIDSKMQSHAERAVRKRMALLQNEFDAHWKGRNPWGNNTSVLKEAMVKSPRYIRLKEDGKSEEEIEAIFNEPVPMELFSWKGSVKKTISPLDSIKYYLKFLNTGLLSVDPKTGYVKAWVGGINHQVLKYDHVKSKRQVGSTFKPIVYAAALEKGVDPCDYFENKLTSYPEFENWTPKNSDGEYGGKYSMRGALAKSVNTISAQVIMQTGVDETINLAQKMGISAKLPAVPSLALGVANISLFDMVTAYTTLANEGYLIKPHYITKIIDRKGKVIREEQSGFGKKAMSYQSAALMVNLMQGVVNEGSAARLRSDFGLTMDIAGKTGTTQNQTDGWFIGITPDLVTGVWVGGEMPVVRFRTLALGQGAHTALPIWGDFMTRIVSDKEFRKYRNSVFPTLEAHLSNRLDCESFIEEDKGDNFLDKFFNNIFSDQKSDEERKREKEIKERERQERWEAHRREREKRKKEKKKKRWIF